MVYCVGMSAHAQHSYAVQQAAFLFALIPFALLTVIMAGAHFFDGLRRARKPLPVRPPGIRLAPRLAARIKVALFRELASRP